MDLQPFASLLKDPKFKVYLIMIAAAVLTWAGVPDHLQAPLMYVLGSVSITLIASMGYVHGKSVEGSVPAGSTAVPRIVVNLGHTLDPAEPPPPELDSLLEELRKAGFDLGPTSPPSPAQAEGKTSAAEAALLGADTNPPTEAKGTS